MANTQFNARTPLNQEPQRGPNFCPFCDYWHPVSSMVPDHVAATHPEQLPKPALTPEDKETARADRADRIAAIRARKAAREGSK